MRVLFLVATLSLVVAGVPVPLRAVRSSPNDMVTQWGAVDECLEGVHYKMNYNTTGFTGQSIINLGDDVHGVHGINCDIDATMLQVEFGELIQLEMFVARLQFVTDFIIINRPSPWACAVDNEDGFLLRRVIGADRDSKTLTLNTIKAKYDELYKVATITYETLDSPCPNQTNYGRHPICIGVNTEQDCNVATKPITIFSNKFLSLTCPDCFLGFSTNLFFTIQISDFKLVSLTAGFKNMTLNGNLVFDLKATADWSPAVDKTVMLIPPTTLIAFKIGPIPFSFSFALPVQLQASANFDATAEMTAGVTMNAVLGDDYNMWVSGQGWTHVRPNPTFSWEPQLTGSWDFSGDAHMAIVPTIQLKIARLYEYDLTLDPQVNMVAYAKHTKPPQLCANFTTETTLTAQSQLNINIPWLDVHSHDTWGPTVIYDTGVKDLGGKCISAVEDYHVRPAAPELPTIARPAPRRAQAPADAEPQKKFERGMGKPIKMYPRTAPLVASKGQQDECVDGTLMRTTWDTLGYGAESVINLDEVKGLAKLQCDLDETALLLTFTDMNSAGNFVNEVNYVTDFLTGGGKWGCNITMSGGGFMIRRILGGEVMGLQVYLGTVPAKYDEIYDTAAITYSSIGSCGGVGEHGICVGVNTEQMCNTPTAPIPIVQGKFITITCSDCFLGFMTDIFIEVHIRGFKMITLSGGFKNMTLNGALVIDMKAEADWNQAVDKTFNIVPPVTLFSFNIGKVPFAFGFTVPVEVKATAQVDAIAEATIGATMSGVFGDNYISYVAGQGWTHVKPNPSIAWEPQVTGHQDFNAQFNFQLIPSIKVTLANIYEYDLVYDPSVTVQAYEQRSPKLALCANVTAQDTLTASSGLNINIPWLDIHSHDTWGPTVIYDSGVIDVGHKCVL